MKIHAGSQNKKTYRTSSKVLVYPGMSGWRFLSLSKKDSQEIKKNFGAQARGWGSLPVSVTIGKTVWQTSVFPDKQSHSYLLPLKARVRKAEEIFDDEQVEFTFKLNI